MTKKICTTLILGLFCAFTIFTIQPPSAQAQTQPITLRISNFMPAKHWFHKEFLSKWAAELERRAGGQVKVEVYAGNSQYGHVAKQADQVRTGIVDIALGLRGFPKGQLPHSTIIELPFLVSGPGAGSLAFWQLYKEGLLGNEYDEFKLIALFVHGGGLIHTTVRPIVELKDLKGLRLRTPSASVSAMLKYLGAEPKGVRPADIYENIEQGAIDGLLTVWDLMTATRLNNLVKYHTDARAYTAAFFVVMNKARYNNLPPRIRQIIDDMSGDALAPKFGKWWTDAGIPGYKDALARGNTIIPVSEEKRDRWREQLKPMINAYLEDLKKRGVNDPQRIYQRAQQLIAHYEKALNKNSDTRTRKNTGQTQRAARTNNNAIARKQGQ